MLTKSCFFIVFIALFTHIAEIGGCKKDNMPEFKTGMVSASDKDNGRTISLLPKQLLIVTLRNPGDGGYAFDSPVFEKDIIGLTGKTHINPDSASAAGDFGKDRWIFHGIKKGSSKLEITATRSFDKEHPVVIFSASIVVK
ncbi:MAG TPA: protease inhibitor I42 family protein [Mucilaginibacter sp.]|nr:protease inhibitor I42 family protein [Mucilaginibacter sp.]